MDSRIDLTGDTVSISELRFLSLVVSQAKSAKLSILVSISELRFLSLVGANCFIDKNAGDLGFNLRIEILIIGSKAYIECDKDNELCFNLRIEILIIGRRDGLCGIDWNKPVSISELRFLSLVGASATTTIKHENRFQSQN